MQCVKCSGQVKRIFGDLELNDKVLGDFKVKDTQWNQCQGCGEILYLPATMKDIEATEVKRKKDLLLNYPLKDFIFATEVAKILNCSRQAVHKHKRIKRGFIHFVMYNGVYHYLKKSVEMFKETNDGRFPLAQSKKQNSSNIVRFSDISKMRQVAPKAQLAIDAVSDSSFEGNKQGNGKSFLESLMEG